MLQSMKSKRVGHDGATERESSVFKSFRMFSGFFLELLIPWSCLFLHYQAIRFSLFAAVSHIPPSSTLQS